MSFLNAPGFSRPGKQQMLQIRPLLSPVAYAAAIASTDEVELDFIFDFGPLEDVVYTGPALFPGRVFLLHFWRHAKDGVMYLLGYHHHAAWRDPTYCYPHSYMEYHKRSAHTNGPGRPAEPADSTGTAGREPRVDRLVARVPVLELEPGLYMVPPSLTGLSIPPDIVRTFPRPLVKVTQLAEAIVSKPLAQNVMFREGSDQFVNRAQAEQALAGVLRVLRSFPQLHAEIVSDAATTLLEPSALYGRSKAARDYLNLAGTGGTFPSLGALMDARARTIRQYLISNGVRPSRLRVRRGELRVGLRRRRVLVIFSNPRP